MMYINGVFCETKNIFENKINAGIFGKNAGFSCILLLKSLHNLFSFTSLMVFRQTLLYDEFQWELLFVSRNFYEVESGL
jgi:hypothetical protein